MAFEGKGIHKLPVFDPTKTPGVDETPYIHQEFPKHKYHPTDPTQNVVVATPEEEDALEAGFLDHPIGSKANTAAKTVVPAAAKPKPVVK